jgi:hypothetical protein
MSLVLQEILVGIAVLLGALFAFWRLASHRLRLRSLALMESLHVPGAIRLGERLRARIRAQQAGACGACAQGATPGGASRSRTPDALRR